MAESMPVSDLMLARYVAGDLQGEQLTRVERALGEIPGLAARLEQIKRERVAFFARSPADAFAHRVVTRLTVEKPARTRWQVWWLLPPVGVGTALVLGVVYQHALGPQAFTRSAEVTTDDQYALAAEAPRGKMLREAPVDAKAEPRRVSAESLPQKPTVAQNSEDRVRNKISGDTDDQFAAPPPPADGAREPHPAKRALVEENAIAGTAKKEVPRSDVERKPTVPHPTPAPVAAEAPPQKRSQTPSAPAAYDTPATAAAPPEAEAEARPYAKAPSQPAASGLFEASKADKADGVLGLGAAGDSASVPTQVTLSREQGGRVRAVVSNDIVTAGTVLNVTTTGGAYVTVVGIRRDGAPHVYGQSAAKQGVGTVAVRLRPASSRVTEAIFVIVGDSAPNIGPNVVTGAKDAAQLPIRLAVPGTQRRYVIVVAAELSE